MDVKITRNGGTTAVSAPGDKAFSVADGVLRQADSALSATMFAGDKSFSDYTLTLKARKLSGTNGFMITVLDDEAGSNVKWILGGWGNKQFGIVSHFAEQDQFIERVLSVLRIAKASGVVVDWQQIDPAYKKDITKFIDKFAEYREVVKNGPPTVAPESFTLMPWLNFAQLPDDDLGAIFTYLKTQKPVRNNVDSHPGFQKAPVSKTVPPQG